MKLNLDYLVECIWDHLDLIRVITKKPGCAPDFDDAIVLRNGVTVASNIMRIKSAVRATAIT